MTSHIRKREVVGGWGCGCRESVAHLGHWSLWLPIPRLVFPAARRAGRRAGLRPPCPPEGEGRSQPGTGILLPFLMGCPPCRTQSAPRGAPAACPEARRCTEPQTLGRSPTHQGCGPRVRLVPPTTGGRARVGSGPQWDQDLDSASTNTDRRTGSRLVVAGGRGGEGGWESGISGCKLVHTGWVGDKILL